MAQGHPSYRRWPAHVRPLHRPDASPHAAAPGEKTAGAAPAKSRHRERPAPHIETLAACVLSVAAVATAWSAYQSTRWSGIMATDFNEAGAIRSESVRLATQAGQSRLADITLAADWLTAQLSGNEQLADALRMRMPLELQKAMDAWLGGWQPGQPIPAGGPFTAGGYVAPGAADAEAMEKNAEAAFADARRSNQHSDNYVLTGVLFALSLFFAGISSRVQGRKNVHRMIYGATAVMAVGIILLIVQPKSFGV